MNTQHTPGPWHVFHEDDRLAVGPDEYIILADLRSYGDDEDLNQEGFGLGDPLADARLIAAAPDMLAALQYCLPHLEKASKLSMPSVIHISIECAVRAAINLATGQTP